MIIYVNHIFRRSILLVYVTPLLHTLVRLTNTANIEFYHSHEEWAEPAVAILQYNCTYKEKYPVVLKNESY
jgi:hypothetical protein